MYEAECRACRALAQHREIISARELREELFVNTSWLIAGDAFMVWSAYPAIASLAYYSEASLLGLYDSAVSVVALGS